MKTREITFLKLTNSLFVPGTGFGELGNVFPSPSRSSVRNIKMFYTPEELSVTLVINNREIVTPITNVTAMTLVPEAK